MRSNRTGRIGRARDYLSSPPGPAVVRGWLTGLVAVDLALILFHLGWRGLQGFDLLGPIPPSLSIFGDVGLAERFNHLKWLILAGFLAMIWWRTGAAVFLVLGGVFALVLADDAFTLHERGSAWLQSAWPAMPSFGMSKAEAGEVAIWAGFGLVILPAIAYGLWTTGRIWWPVAGYVLAAFAGVVFFAVVFDVMQEPLHHIAHPGWRYWLLYAASVIECAGEALFASLALAYGAGIHSVYGRAAAPAVNPAE